MFYREALYKHSVGMFKVFGKCLAGIGKMRWWFIGLHIREELDEVSHKESLIKVMSPGIESKEVECG